MVLYSFLACLNGRYVYPRSQCLSKPPLPNAKAAKLTFPTSCASPSAQPRGLAPAPCAISPICPPTPAISSPPPSKANPSFLSTPCNCMKLWTTAVGCPQPHLATL